MADHCTFCNTHRPTGGTRILIVGSEFLEFCNDCTDVKLENQLTGEICTISELFERGNQLKEGGQ